MQISSGLSCRPMLAESVAAGRVWRDRSKYADITVDCDRAGAVQLPTRKEDTCEPLNMTGYGQLSHKSRS